MVKELPDYLATAHIIAGAPVSISRPQKKKKNAVPVMLVFQRILT